MADNSDKEKDEKDKAKHEPKKRYRVRDDVSSLTAPVFAADDPKHERPPVKRYHLAGETLPDEMHPDDIAHFLKLKLIKEF